MTIGITGFQTTHDILQGLKQAASTTPQRCQSSQRGYVYTPIACHECSKKAGDGVSVYRIEMKTRTKHGMAMALGNLCLECMVSKPKYFTPVVEALTDHHSQANQYREKDARYLWTHILQNHERIPKRLHRHVFAYAAPMMMFPDPYGRRWDHKIPFDVWKPLAERWKVRGKALPDTLVTVGLWQTAMRMMPQKLWRQVNAEKAWFRSFLIPTFQEVKRSQLLPAIELHNMGLATVEELMTTPLLSPHETVEKRLIALGPEVTPEIAAVLERYDSKMVGLPLEWSLRFILEDAR